MGRDSASRANNSPPDAESPAPAHDSSTATDRSGRDERRRGWFWHWNGIVTQYVPLIGLKGVGLLNSYTVWTDRREDSPHRGYAFPSQQSEANFYGEDRSELITINKILVALDLIEIRKEMVRKTDEKGRRWKVPQNLYRVKDRQDGLDLTTADVIRVVELADRDKTVYRYIRKIFSAKFEPINRNNVWHEILKEVDDHPTWRKLADRAARQEAKASARTKAGHRSRALHREQTTEDEGPEPEAIDGTPDREAQRPAQADTGALRTTGHASTCSLDMDEQTTETGREEVTIAALPNRASTPAVAKSNNGSEKADDPGSNGLDGIERGSVADTNNGHESSVEPGNTMYYQSSSTTTTTTTSPPGNAGGVGSANGDPADREPDHRSNERQDEERMARDSSGSDRDSPPEDDSDIVTRDAPPGRRSPDRGVAGTAGGGPLGDPSPLVLSLYEAANDRTATRLERILLSELEADAGPPAQATGSTGPDWVAAALREAVGSGSAFVAPKRIREIINRWASSGAGPTGCGPDSTDGEREIRHAESQDHDQRSVPKQTRDDMRERNRPSDVYEVTPADAVQGERLWSVVLDILAAEGAGNDLFRLRGVMPIGERSEGDFLLGAPTRLAVRMLDGTHRRAVEQALSSLLPSPVAITILNPDQWRIVG